MIRELILLVPKKNSKTTNGALLMLTALLLNQRPNAPMIMTAPVQDVAEIAFSAVAGAIALDPVLDEEAARARSPEDDRAPGDEGELQIMTFDPAVLTGQKLIAALIDELHVVAKMGKAASALRQIRGGMLPYPEAFLATSRRRARNRRPASSLPSCEGARDPRRHAARARCCRCCTSSRRKIQKPKELWQDPARLAAGHAERRPIDHDRAADRGVRDREGDERGGAARLGVAAPERRDRPRAALESLGRRRLLGKGRCRTHARRAARTQRGRDDRDRRRRPRRHARRAVLGRTADGEWLLWSHAWIHPIVLERRKAEADRYRDFERDGDLTICAQRPGEDVDAVADIVEQVEASGLLDRVGVDPVGIGEIPTR
jgi:hypothetical protein